MATLTFRFYYAELCMHTTQSHAVYGDSRTQTCYSVLLRPIGRAFAELSLMPTFVGGGHSSPIKQSSVSSCDRVGDDCIWKETSLPAPGALLPPCKGERVSPCFSSQQRLCSFIASLKGQRSALCSNSWFTGDLGYSIGPSAPL